MTSIVPAAEQRAALKALLGTLDPAVLTLPEHILNLIPPRPPGYPRTRETFPSKTGVTFDPMSAAEGAADLTASLILDPQRAARLVQYHARDRNNPGLREVIDAVMAATWHSEDRKGLEREIAHTIDYVVLSRLMALAVDTSAPAEVRSIATDKVSELKSYLSSAHVEADLKYGLTLINIFETHPERLDLPQEVEIPPGQPFGEDEEFLRIGPFVREKPR